MRNTIDSAPKMTVRFPGNEVFDDSSLRAPRARPQTGATMSPKMAKLIGAGVAMAGVGLALHAVSQLPKSRAQQFTGTGNIMPNPALIVEQAVNGMINQVIGAMNQVGCVSVCVWDRGSIQNWCAATVGMALAYARVPGGAAGAAGTQVAVYQACTRLVNTVNALCAQANCR